MRSNQDIEFYLNRFLESASVAQKWRTLADLERRLQMRIGRAFRRQQAVFLRGFEGLRGRFVENGQYSPTLALPQREGIVTAELREAITADDWLRVFDEATSQTFDLFFEAIQEHIATALLQGGVETLASVGVDFSFSLRHPRAEAYLAEHGSALITRINEVTRGNIQTILAEGIREGWSYDRIARAITQMYSEMAVGKPQEHIDSRAHLIAVTELGNAYEAGSSIVVRDLQDSGLYMEKSWLTVGDDRVSDGCRSNEAEGWIAFELAHVSGHQHPLRFPGCRCTELYRRRQAPP